MLGLRGLAGKPDDEGMPVLPPSTSLGELRAAFRLQLPGATLRRGLYWRYLLTWRRPEDLLDGSRAGKKRCQHGPLRPTVSRWSLGLMVLHQRARSDRSRVASHGVSWARVARSKTVTISLA